MINALAVFLGGGLGALARYGIGKWALAWFGDGFPVGTMAVNVVGSLVIGLAIGALEGVRETARLFFVVGLLGGFTTFSAFSLDALTLWERDAYGLAFLYIGGSLALSLFACALGFQIAR